MRRHGVKVPRLPKVKQVWPQNHYPSPHTSSYQLVGHHQLAQVTQRLDKKAWTWLHQVTPKITRHPCLVPLGAPNAPASRRFRAQNTHVHTHTHLSIPPQTLGSDTLTEPQRSPPHNQHTAAPPSSNHASSAVRQAKKSSSAGRDAAVAPRVREMLSRAPSVEAAASCDKPTNQHKPSPPIVKSNSELFVI